MRTVRQLIVLVVLAAVSLLPVFGQSSNPADWSREIVERWYASVEQLADGTNVSGLISFNHACGDWGLNYTPARDKDAYEAAYPRPVPPMRAVQGEVRVHPDYGTYLIPALIYTDEPIAAPCEVPKRDIAPDGAYGFGDPVDPRNPNGNLLIAWPTTIPADSIRQNPENGRDYKLVVWVYGSFTAKWWAPVGAP